VANGLIEWHTPATKEPESGGLMSRRIYMIYFCTVERHKVLFKYELFSSTIYPTWPIKLPFFKCKRNNVTANAKYYI